jgi:hypothetical protein
MGVAQFGLGFAELTGKAKAASGASRAARMGHGRRWQRNGRPVKINRTERVLHEVLDHGEADRLPACGPEVDPRSSEAIPTGRVVNKARNRPLNRQRGIPTGEDAALTLHSGGEHGLRQGAERCLEPAGARCHAPLNLVAGDVRRQLQRLAIRVGGRPGGAAVGQPGKWVAGDHEQPQRRRELRLDTLKSVPARRELKQVIPVCRRDGQQLERVVRARFGRHRVDRMKPTQCAACGRSGSELMVILRAVSKGKRSRRPGGHPANVAVRREREAARRSGAGTTPEAIARRMVREAEGLTGALDAELWASEMLGAFWNQRTNLPLGESADYAMIYGGPLVEAVARLGGPGARITLRAIAALDDAELGGLASELAGHTDDQGSEPPPSWLAGVGETEITQAAVMREDIFDDGFTMFLEARHPTGESHAVGVYIDNNLGMMAKDILLADSIDRVAEIMRENPADDGEVRLDPIDPAAAAAEIHTAMDLTEMTLGPPVSEDYAGLRALAMLRADEAPGGAVATEREELPGEHRDALRDEFLASPEGRAFAPDSDEAFVVSLAIDFGADYVDGRPLRWSPVVVELFMADWVPRKVLADTATFEVLPSALDAWVRFAGRKRGSPAWAIAMTQAAIPQWRDEMSSLAGDPANGGLGKQFLTAAQQAGVDVSDERALTTFIAGWNGRGIAP